MSIFLIRSYQICCRNAGFVIIVEICDILVSISYFDQILGKTASQTRQAFNYAGI